MRKIWLNRDFSLLWTGQLISQIGDKFYAIALAWWILTKTGSPAIMGLYLVASALPGLVLGPLAGGCTDRWNRKTVLIAMDLLRAAIILGVTILATAGNLQIWHLFTAAVIVSLASAFFSPAASAALPQIVSGDEIPKANAMNQLISGSTTVIGPLEAV